MIHQSVLINDVEIDVKISSLIQEMWKQNVRTFECCQGGKVDLLEMFEVESFSEFLKVYDIKELDPTSWFYIEEEDIYEYAFIIIHRDNYQNAKKILQEHNIIEFNVESGTGGYCPSEYNNNCPSYDNMLFIRFKPIL